jgi:hypothetical protein
MTNTPSNVSGVELLALSFLTSIGQKYIVLDLQHVVGCQMYRKYAVQVEIFSRKVYIQYLIRIFDDDHRRLTLRLQNCQNQYSVPHCKQLKLVLTDVK